MRSMMMRYALLVFGLVVGIASRAEADLIYSDGPINGTTTAYTINNFIGGGGDSVSDSFTVSGNATATDATIGLWTESGTAPVTVDWSVGSSAFGSDVASGTSTLTNVQLTPATSYGFNGEYSVYQSSFSLLAALTTGTYWLTLSNATNTISGSDVYWDADRGPSSAFQKPNGGLAVSAAAESFSLYDNSSPNGGAVPEPSTLISAGIAGLFGLGYAWRRRKATTRRDQVGSEPATSGIPSDHFGSGGSGGTGSQG